MDLHKFTCHGNDEGMIIFQAFSRMVETRESQKSCMIHLTPTTYSVLTALWFLYMHVSSADLTTLTFITLNMMRFLLPIDEQGTLRNFSDARKKILLSNVCIESLCIDADQSINVIILKQQIDSLCLEILYKAWHAVKVSVMTREIRCRFENPKLFRVKLTYTIHIHCKSRSKEDAESWKLHCHYLTYIVTYGEHYSDVGCKKRKRKRKKKHFRSRQNPINVQGDFGGCLVDILVFFQVQLVYMLASMNVEKPAASYR